MQELTELHTIRDMLRFAVSRFYEARLFYGHGTDSAWDEAVSLILHALYLPHDINPQVLDARLTSIERQQVYQLLQRRIKERMPVPYLTHEAWFADLPFFVDERVLIPRSPIAESILNRFQPWIEEDQVHRILDLCTGSGCIAIACAKAFPDAEVVASDISEDALAVAKINVLRHNLEEQVILQQSDLFQSIPKQKFDIIVSNPPYVDAEDMLSLPDEYRHEPRLGLAAGQDGLDIVEKILKQASHYLNKDGILVVEVGNSERALIEKHPELPFTWLDFERGDGGVFLLRASEL